LKDEDHTSTNKTVRSHLLLEYPCHNVDLVNAFHSQVFVNAVKKESYRGKTNI